MVSFLCHLDCADLLQNRVIEWHVKMEGDTVETLQTEDQFIKQQLGLLVQSADKSMSLIEPQQNLQRPFQFGEPDVKRGHAAIKRHC